MSELIIKIESEGVSKEDLIYELRDMQDQMITGYDRGELLIKHLGKNSQWYDKKGSWELTFKEDEK